VCVIASYGASGDFSLVDEHRFSCAACRLPLVLLSRDCFRVFLGACFWIMNHLQTEDGRDCPLCIQVCVCVRDLYSSVRCVWYSSADVNVHLYYWPKSFGIHITSLSLFISVSVFRPWMWTAVSFTRWRSQLRPFTLPVWVSDLRHFTASALCHTSSQPLSWCGRCLIGLQSGNLWSTSAHPSDTMNALRFIYRWHFWCMICW